MVDAEPLKIYHPKHGTLVPVLVMDEGGGELSMLLWNPSTNRYYKIVEVDELLDNNN